MTQYTGEEEFQMLLHAKESLEAAKERKLRESLEIQQSLLDKINELQKQLSDEKERYSQEINLLDQSLKAHVDQLKRDYNYPPKQEKIIHHDESWWHEDDSDK